MSDLSFVNEKMGLIQFLSHYFLEVFRKISYFFPEDFQIITSSFKDREGLNNTKSEHFVLGEITSHFL